MMFPGNVFGPCGFIDRAPVKRFYLLGVVRWLFVATFLLAVPGARQSPVSGSEQGSLFCLIICDSSFSLWVRRGTRNVVAHGAKVLLPATVRYGNRTCFCSVVFYGVCDAGAKGWRGSQILLESPSSDSDIYAQPGPVFGSCLLDIGQRSAAP